MASITVSKEYGVNPTVETCAICGKEMGVALLSTGYKVNGKTAEAPHKMCLGNVCDECEGVIKQGGIFIVEVRDGESESNPYRTGRLIAVRESVAKEMFNKYGKMNYMEHSIFENLFGHLLTPPQANNLV